MHALEHYFDPMGIFSRSKPENIKPDNEARLASIITKFQNWIPTDFFLDVNGVAYDCQKLRVVVDYLVRWSAPIEDEQLLQFVGKSCAGFGEAVLKESTEDLAQFLFGLTTASMELQKRFSSEKTVVEGVIALGLACTSTLQRHPKFADALEYMSANSQKLASN